MKGRRDIEVELIKKAMEMKERAYAPYSKFKVGAALLAKSGKIYGGCNVENASYGLSVCAERVAIFKAVSEGEREFEKLAVVTDLDEPAAPCGMCRQVMIEFGDFEVIMVSRDGSKIERKKVSELIPKAFTPSHLKKVADDGSKKS